MFFGYLLLTSGYFGGFHGALLGDEGVLTLNLGLAAHLFGYFRLCDGFLALFVTDAAFFVGNLLHLGVDALHHYRTLLLLGEQVKLILQFLVLLDELIVSGVNQVDVMS